MGCCWAHGPSSTAGCDGALDRNHDHMVRRQWLSVGIFYGQSSVVENCDRHGIDCGYSGRSLRSVETRQVGAYSVTALVPLASKKETL